MKLTVAPISSTGNGLVREYLGMLMTTAVSSSSEHHMIHAGSSFNSSVVNQTVSNTATVNIALEPTGGYSAHTVFSVAAEGKTRVSLVENPTGYSGGVVISGYNRNRNYDNNSVTVVKTGVTSIGGKTIYNTTLFGGTGPQSIGAANEARDEWVLKNGNKYVLSATNAAGADKDIYFNLSWYEAKQNFHE